MEKDPSKKVLPVMRMVTASSQFQLPSLVTAEVASSLAMGCKWMTIPALMACVFDVTKCLNLSTRIAT